MFTNSLKGRVAVLAGSLALASVMSVASFSAHAESYLDKIKANGVIKVGIIIDFPPYGTTDVHNKPDGYDADVAKLLDRKSTRLTPVTNAHLVCRLLLEKNKINNYTINNTIQA